MVASRSMWRARTGTSRTTPAARSPVSYSTPTTRTRTGTGSSIGRDLDNDGVSIFNIYPEGGDPREDLLDFYEKQTNTLVFRPVVPLREKTTYAVVSRNA